MANRKIVVLLVAALCLVAGCVKKAPEQQPDAPPAKPAPGPKLLLDQAALSRELQCDKLQLPFASLESNVLSPERVAPGGEVHHRIVYAYCPAQGGGPEKGTLTRKLSLKGRTVFLDQDKDFVLTPGRSAVDAFFLVPEAATPGTYVLEVEFRSTGKSSHGSKAVSFSAKEALFIGAEQ